MKLSDPSLFRSHALIGGRWQDAADGARLTVRNPATDALVGHVPLCSEDDTIRAVEAAHAAFAGWRAQTAKARAQLLRGWFDLILQHRDDLAIIMVSEQGKPLAEARGEIDYAASFIDWFAGEARRVTGDVMASPWADRRLFTLRQPVGVAALITPWNFPAAMLTRKAGAALAAGCTVVAKPASQTPFTALALAELAQRAGLPPGVLNVITGDAATLGDVLTTHPWVRKLSFTGSTDVGKYLLARCAGSLKHVSLELGGNAPFIVFDDADLDAAVAGALASKYRNGGQTCVCANRVFVQAGVYHAFAEKFVAAVAQLNVGEGFTPGVDIGPMISDSAVSRIETHLVDAQAHGATVLTGGSRHARGGRFFQPTVLGDCTPAMALCRSETFGPVAPLIRFEHEADALAMANDSDYGLAAYAYTRDLARAWRVAEALEYGMVGINTGLMSTAEASFGGMKQSGLGREGGLSGIDEYLESKSLALGGLA
ncbi:MAG: succinate-semialdehyde dehydrogenase (NADP(+)) [Hydrogenophilales bacterium 16-64-46]|nr:MAG: succinate-semialdehyde dehydrogenase (NADP(+)) [Hydrogenophilales bacterium 12-64-13]OYZ06703.1 MAG: succinate-semialdehyde dehydrogenase (NADP(+)) [Hydrogenophilales bacterium 16-64-46]HQT00967.1 NAD-dependent succinate-semialdehyde dehydrogenase [Thiobacillus sp.]